MLYLILSLILLALACRLAAGLRRLWRTIPASNRDFFWEWR